MVVPFAVILFSAVLYLWTDRGAEVTRKLVGYNHAGLTLLWGMLMVLYVAYCEVTGGLQSNFWIIGLYTLVPVVIWIWGTANQTVPSLLTQTLVAASMWFPVDMRILPKRVFEGKFRNLDFAYIFLTQVVILLVLWKVWAKSPGLKANWRLSPLSFLWTAFLLVGTAILVIPTGLLTGFLKPNPAFSDVDLYAWPGMVAMILLSWPFVLRVLQIVAVTALPEEILFRGVVQNLLDQKWGEKFWTLVVGSVIFGAGHLNNGATSWHPYGWNWKYFAFSAAVGGVYTLLYRKTDSLLFPILLHALVDAIWGTFFPH